MLRDAIINFQSIFVSPSEVEAYRHMVPRQVSIQYKIDDGSYIAFLEAVDDDKVKGLLITEGKSEQELNRNLNQLIYMNAKVPEKVRPYYGNMFDFSISENAAKSGELVLARA
jgi:hypothetical protein